MNGCRTPYIPTTFGPVLLCKIANNFLSKTVIQATANKIGTIKNKHLLQNKQKINLNLKYY